MQYIPEEPVCKYNNVPGSESCWYIILLYFSRYQCCHWCRGGGRATYQCCHWCRGGGRATYSHSFPYHNSLHSIARRHKVPMHHMSSQLFTERIVAEARMISCIASWGYSNYVFSPSYIVSPMLLSSVACVFTSHFCICILTW